MSLSYPPLPPCTTPASCSQTLLSYHPSLPALHLPHVPRRYCPIIPPSLHYICLMFPDTTVLSSLPPCTTPASCSQTLLSYHPSLPALHLPHVPRRYCPIIPPSLHYTCLMFPDATDVTSYFLFTSVLWWMETKMGKTQNWANHMVYHHIHPNSCESKGGHCNCRNTKNCCVWYVQSIRCCGTRRC